MSEANAQSGAKSRARADLMRIFAAAVAAVEPRRVVDGIFDGSLPGTDQIATTIEQARRVSLLAAGKAALGMTLATREKIGSKVHRALVVVPGPAAPQSEGEFSIMAAAHPTPDVSSEAAGRAALQFVADAQGDQLIVFLLSGGASSLMAVPAEGLILEHKVAVSLALMNSGASIHELNTVRRHLSAIKGGQMLLAARAKFLTVIISDVPGNDVATIGSGPTAADPTTYYDAIAILKRRGVWGRAPEAVRHHLERGVAGEVRETLKNDDSALQRACNVVVADNGTAVEAAYHRAAELGYEVDRYCDLSGDANEAGRALGAYLCRLERKRICVIAGGETVVKLKGRGKGGRAQQAALAAAVELASSGTNRRIAALFAGTDGIDGPTDAAGAIATPDTVTRAAEAKLDPQRALAGNDCYSFFKALGDLVITGPTGTNVADIFVGLVNY